MLENTESWEKSVPPDLMAAVKHLRHSFDRAHWGCSHTTERFCYAILHGTEVDDPANEYINYLVHMKGVAGPAATKRFHDLIKQGTPPAFFKAFLDLYLDALTTEVLRIFHELAEAGRVNQRKLAVPHLEWAQAMVKDLIHSDRHVLRMWVQNVCDKQPYDPNDDSDERFLWKKWQAPSFLIMKPSRYQPFDAAAVWSRNPAESSQQWLDSFAKDYELRLMSRVKMAAGELALQMAKQPKDDPANEIGSSSGLTANSSSGAHSPGTKRETRKLNTQARYKRWQKKYKELIKVRPDMSDVWYSQQIEKSNLAEGHSADTIRKHMTK